MRKMVFILFISLIPLELWAEPIHYVGGKAGNKIEQNSGHFLEVVDQLYIKDEWGETQTSTQTSIATSEPSIITTYVNEVTEGMRLRGAEIWSQAAYGDNLIVEGEGRGEIKYRFSGRLEGGASEDIGEPEFLYTGFYFTHQGVRQEGLNIWDVYGDFQFESEWLPIEYNVPFEFSMFAQSYAMLANGDGLYGPTFLNLQLEGWENREIEMVHAPEPSTFILLGLGLLLRRFV